MPHEHKIILTANQRLSTFLLEKQELSHRTQDRLPLSSWVMRLYETLDSSVMILSEFQELVLWKNIITESLPEFSLDTVLLRPWATAQTVQQAWHLLRQWQIPLSHLEHAQSLEVQMFYRWATTFQALCQDQKWSDSSYPIAFLIQQLKNANSVPLPSHITLAGFAQMSPQTATLLQLLAKRVALEHLPLPSLNKKTARAAFVNEADELRGMAHWAHREWSTDPQAKIACIVPELNARRDEIERIFGILFEENHDAFNISGGRSLKQYPMIHTAFQLLQLFSNSALEVELLSAIIRSPFIAVAEQEMTQRAALDVALRALGESHLRLAAVASQLDFTQCPELAIHLETFRRLLEQNPAHQKISAWAQQFSEILQCMGWPGERGLNSSEYQQLQRFQTLLAEFTRLEVLSTRSITYHDALEQLDKLASRTVFQPQSAPAWIQILGTLEAIGMHFDALWVMGMNEEHWPKAPAPNPFLPLDLQRRYQMPHADAEIELAFSQRMTQHFVQSAQGVILSYCLQQDDIPLRPSSLIQNFPETSLHFAPLNLEFVHSLETLIDDQGPLLSATETVRGGASILKNQAACPFRAFAIHRLGATPLPDIVSGYTAQERGIHLHAVLERLWGILLTHDTLCRYEEAQLDELIHSILLQQLGNKSRLQLIEAKRLHQLIKQWLALEKQRPAFKVVGREILRQVEFAGLPLQLRIDREDELADGSRLIIDYKTGLSRIDDWFSDRPKEPQLPLYLLTSEQLTTGLLFAQVRHNQSTFKGISVQVLDIKGVESIQDWSTFEQEQRAVLTQLAQDFQQGKAHVDPKDPQETCLYCELKPLCRIEN